MGLKKKQPVKTKVDFIDSRTRSRMRTLYSSQSSLSSYHAEGFNERYDQAPEEKLILKESETEGLIFRRKKDGSLHMKFSAPFSFITAFSVALSALGGAELSPPQKGQSLS